jgi:ribose 5-phosphate isomerase B
MVSDSAEMTDAALADQMEKVRESLRQQLTGPARSGAAGPISSAPVAGMTDPTPPASSLPLVPPGETGTPDSPAKVPTARWRTGSAPAPGPAPGAERRVAIGADHGGFELKCRLVELLEELGYEPHDVGTHSPAAVDYPDFALKVARTVARGEAWRGIMIDGAGIGSAMAANKVPGVRAATCHNEATVVNSRQHNNANVLVLGSGQVNRGLARRLVRIWLRTEFSGGRHARRVEKIDALDR